MSLFIYEYASATTAPLAESLRREGRAMLTALLDDATKIAGLEACTILAEYVLPPPGVVVHRAPGADEETFRRVAAVADWTLAVAPESSDILHSLCLTAGRHWLGSGAEAIRLTGDKLAFYRILSEHGVPTPETVELKALDGWPAAWTAGVLKPRDGAGARATFLVRDADELARCIAESRREGLAGQSLVQEFVPGKSASVSFLIGPRATLPLPPSAQLQSSDGRFRYLGGSLPLPSDESARAVRLARQAVAAVPGLAGFVGVDLVLGAAADGTQDRVLEINPRVTTSYVGLRRLARFNLLEVLLTLWAGQVPPPLAWHSGHVTFWV